MASGSNAWLLTVKIEKVKLSLQQAMEAHMVVRRKGSHNRLTDGGEVVSLTHRQPFTLQEDSWYSFLLEAVLTTGPWRGWKD
jgi:hypothetical protein